MLEKHERLHMKIHAQCLQDLNHAPQDTLVLILDWAGSICVAHYRRPGEKVGGEKARALPQKPTPILQAAASLKSTALPLLYYCCG